MHACLLPVREHTQCEQLRMCPSTDEPTMPQSSKEVQRGGERLYALLARQRNQLHDGKDQMLCLPRHACPTYVCTFPFLTRTSAQVVWNMGLASLLKVYAMGLRLKQ